MVKICDSEKRYAVRSHLKIRLGTGVMWGISNFITYTYNRSKYLLYNE